MASSSSFSVAETESTEQSRIRRSRYNHNNNHNNPISPSPPSPQISPLLQSTRCKPTISSLFLSTFTTPSSNNNVSTLGIEASSSLKSKKKNFSSSTFRGLGCATSSSQVSTPAAAVVVRSSADWQAKKVRKKKQRKKKNQDQQQQQQNNISSNNPNSSVIVVPDVWCAPGIGFSSSSDATSDCVVSRRQVQGRGRSDGERINHRERSCTARRVGNLEHLTILDSPSEIETSRFGSDALGARHHRHFRHRSPGGLAEIMMFQSSLMMGGRSDGYDRHRDWRLDVDRMSYEELLELGDRIGYVSTGLREDEILRCLRKTKHAILGALSSRFATEVDWKCSICQEEYEMGDEVGKLECGHSYHMCCIKQWLLQKNACPVCKVAAASQY